MKNLLTKEQIVCERMEANMKTLMAMAHSDSGSLKELHKVTGLDEMRSFQASATLWSLGVMRWIDPETKEAKDVIETRNIEDYGNELKKWAISREEFENDGEYVFATISLLPGSTFKELRVLTELDEHNLCVAIMWLCENGRIFIQDDDNASEDENEMYFVTGIFNMK